MTAIAVTLTKRAAWLSSDSYLSQVTPEQLAMPALSGEEITSTPRADAVHLPCAGHRNKLWHSDEAKFAVAWAGAMAPADEFRRFCEQCLWSSVDDLAQIAPDMLNQALARVAVPWRQLMTIVVGWSPRAGRCVGYSFRSSEGNRREELPDGHRFQPIWPADDPMAETLSRTGHYAALGAEVEAFHLAACRTLARCSRAGLYRTSGIGGTLHTVKVTRDGVSLRTNGTLEG